MADENGTDELGRLRRLDEEYGRVEAAIIMADPEFDGDSDHENCGDRLIASVERLRLRAETAERALRDGDELLDYALQDDTHNRLTPRVIDIAYTAFMRGATGRNPDDGGPCDWFTDTKPAIEKAIGRLRDDLREAGLCVPRRVSADPRPERVVYRNWKGEVAERLITPLTVWHGSTEWHPEPQWFLRARDERKGAVRDFALRDFVGKGVSRVRLDNLVWKVLLDLSRQGETSPSETHWRVTDALVSEGFVVVKPQEGMAAQGEGEG